MSKLSFRVSTCPYDKIKAKPKTIPNKITTHATTDVVLLSLRDFFTSLIISLDKLLDLHILLY